MSPHARRTDPPKPKGSSAVAALAGGAEVVVFGSWDGRVYGVDAASGATRWATRLGAGGGVATGGGVGSSPVLSADHRTA